MNGEDPRKNSLQGSGAQHKSQAEKRDAREAATKNISTQAFVLYFVSFPFLVVWRGVWATLSPRSSRRGRRPALPPGLLVPHQPQGRPGDGGVVPSYGRRQVLRRLGERSRGRRDPFLRVGGGIFVNAVDVASPSSSSSYSALPLLGQHGLDDGGVRLGMSVDPATVCDGVLQSSDAGLAFLFLLHVVSLALVVASPLLGAPLQSVQRTKDVHLDRSVVPFVVPVRSLLGGRHVGKGDVVAHGDWTEADDAASSLVGIVISTALAFLFVLENGVVQVEQRQVEPFETPVGPRHGNLAFLFLRLIALLRGEVGPRRSVPGVHSRKSRGEQHIVAAAVVVAIAEADADAHGAPAQLGQLAELGELYR
mmetsp:Transcript_50691/g.93719  ORF Transcript_50691/g.93719 Transcript_50691/m.93719 type:complete len:365 (-) Transcript_50691:642-1736(-)